MDVVAVVASVALGVSFLVAGASKVASGAAWSHQARDLGAPGWVVPVLPWIEIVLGAVLVTQLARTVAAIVAATLLAAFTGLIAVRLAEGRRPPCACFGAWSVKPLGPGHVVRNGVLFALAIVAALG